jgi:hypothetical protein
VQCRHDDWHACKLCGEATPEHFVASTDGYHRVDFSRTHEPPQAWQNPHIKLARQQVAMHGHFVGKEFAEWARFFEAGDLRRKPLVIKTTNQVHQKRFSTTDRHAGNEKEDTQRLCGWCWHDFSLGYLQRHKQ